VTLAERDGLGAKRAKVSGFHSNRGGLLRLASGGWGSPVNVRLWHLAQIAAGNFHIPILGQLPPSDFPLGNALEPGSLEIVGLDTPLGDGRLRQ
jgi:hypothetical protein